MFTSFIYHGFGIKGFSHIGTSYCEKGTYMHLEPQKRLYVCSNCGSKHVTTRGTVQRTIKTIPVGCREDCYFTVNIPKLHCHNCGLIRQMNIKFADPRKSYTNQLANFIIILCSIASMLDVSRLLNLHWTIIKEVLKSFLAKKYDKPDLRNITMISIDEISTHKRHKYVTIVINAETGQPLFVGDGKSEESLAPFWEMLGPRRRKRIQAVAIDMGIAYISAVKKNLPNAKIVFDHFHVIKLVNEALNSLRRKVYATASSEDKTVLAGTKYLLLQNPETFPEDSPKAERLKQLLALNTPLTCGYILKEDIRQIWQKKNKLVASRALAKWIETARSSGEELLIKLADTIERHSEGILNWYDHAINSGLIEGINNKIKVMKRKAYGFADMPFFKLLIKAIRGTRQELILRT